MKAFRILIIVLLLCTAVAGCRRNRGHRGERETTEQSARGGRTGYSFTDSEANARYSAQLQEVAQGSDYDAMLDFMARGVTDLRRLRDTYMEGEMTDSELQEHMDRLGDIYRPVMDALSEAQKRGDLNYRQHKKMMQLVQQYVGLLEESMNVITNDFLN